MKYSLRKMFSWVTVAGILLAIVRVPLRQILANGIDGSFPLGVAYGMYPILYLVDCVPTKALGGPDPLKAFGLLCGVAIDMVVIVVIVNVVIAIINWGNRDDRDAT